MELHDVPGIGEKTLAILTKHEIVTITDLVSYYPRSYRAYHATDAVNAAEGEWVSLLGTVSRPASHHTGRLTTQIATFTDGSGTLTLRWLNSPFVTRAVMPSTTYVVRGQIEVFAGHHQIVNPEIKKLPNSRSTIYDRRSTYIQPIYTALGSLKSGNIRKIMLSTVGCIGELPDPLSKDIRAQYNLLDLTTALAFVHFPPSSVDLEHALHRLGFDELYTLQLEALKNRELNRVKTTPLEWDTKIVERWLATLPFAPTGAQERSIAEILADLRKPTAMHRLLQGEVGSGKTLVAAAAALATHASGHQTLILAPTQILAEQLYSAMQNFLGTTLTVSLVTHELKGSTAANVVVGTQALLVDRHTFGRIGLVIVDEQHRFGVEQRLLLTRVSPAPHFLMMTATPIPRTLAMTVFANMDISHLDELPKNRLRTKTYYVTEEKRDDAYDWVRREAEGGNQAFVVVPVIDKAEDEEGNEKKSLAALELDLKKRFPHLVVDVMHGRMKEGEKIAHLQKFRDGATHILVATSMVEVGIDIPSANIMVVEDAERFGLAQLHQLRGRVGRGGEQGHCLVFSRSVSPKAKDRLAYFVREGDGAKLAEYDLRSRGPGELFGTLQHGFVSLKIASLYDTDLLRETHEAALLVAKNTVST